jgi:hypothetical protein
MAQKTETAAVAPAMSEARATMVSLAGWLVPGLGYFLLRRWWRGALVLACVAGAFLIGLALGGQLYGFNTGDVLDILGWIGDFFAGGLYFVTRAFGAGLGDPYVVWGDYGTKFMIAAGLLNVLGAADCFDIAMGRKA